MYLKIFMDKILSQYKNVQSIFWKVIVQFYYLPPQKNPIIPMIISNTSLGLVPVIAIP
jgi:hypothetical protein